MRGQASSSGRIRGWACGFGAGGRCRLSQPLAGVSAAGGGVGKVPAPVRKGVDTRAEDDKSEAADDDTPDMALRIHKSKSELV